LSCVQSDNWDLDKYYFSPVTLLASQLRSIVRYAAGQRWARPLPARLIMVRSAAMAKALGSGGVFFRAKDPAGLLRWYGDTLGLPIEAHGASALFTEPVGAPAAFATFAADTDYFGLTGQGFMVNLRVDDLDGCLQAVAGSGGIVERNTMDEPYGRFGWFSDPEGNRVELWELKKPTAQQ
jgi:predicted enzyme related to lactoylglutathione lyase